MSLSGDRLARAERRADLARDRLRATADRLRARLAPSQLLEDAFEEGRRLTETGAARAKEHPLAVAGLGALFSAAAWLIRRRKRRRATDAHPESLPTERAAPRRSRRSR
jgi:LPXTG-motif cell wall-anchored protein